MTAEERRSSILVAARREFARVGYHGASTASIARVAGCSEPMLYKHFAGKQALFTAALEQVGALVEESYVALTNTSGNLLQLVTEALPHMMADAHYVEMLRLRKLAVAIAEEPEIKQALQHHNERHLLRTRALVERGKAEGDIAHSVDPEYVAWAWMGLMLAGCFRDSCEEDGFLNMEPHVQMFIRSLRGS